MVLIDEHVELSAGSLQDVPEFLVDDGTLVFHLVQDRVQDNYILQYVLLEHIDLIQNDIRVQDEVVRELVLVDGRFRKWS